MRIVKEGLVFIIPSLVLSLFSLLAGWWILFIPFILLTLASCFFFRDPVRRPPRDSDALLSPADGKIVKIQSVESCPGFRSPGTLISIFLSLLDVHLTRAPMSGVVKEIEYRPGRFLRANKDEASLENEQISVFLEGAQGIILVKHIVGFAARRIKCFVRKNEKVLKAHKISLMYFGSRVDLYLPRDIRVKVVLNQKVKAGMTEIAEVSHEKKPEAN